MTQSSTKHKQWINHHQTSTRPVVVVDDVSVNNLSRVVFPHYAHLFKPKSNHTDRRTVHMPIGEVEGGMPQQLIILPLSTVTMWGVEVY